jgi:UDP-3-O-acyl N-acetylglucosamine deacetylase
VTLFTATHSSLIIRPAPGGHGIVFRRTDLPDQPRIPAIITHLIPESRHTVLAADPSDRAAAGSPAGAVVHTVEHILSALAAMGVTDALLDLHGPEVPIGDGSAALFTDAIAEAGVRELPAMPGTAPAPIRVRERIEVADRSAMIEVLPPVGPGDCLELEYRLDYGASSPIPAQRAVCRLTHTAGADAAGYRREVAPARTFCLLEEAQAMQKMGLFRHLSPSDMLVIGEDGRPIDNELRFADEPARHKLLDLIGDLALAGRPIIGRVIASRSGHALNHEAARRLLAHAGD